MGIFLEGLYAGGRWGEGDTKLSFTKKYGRGFQNHIRYIAVNLYLLKFLLIVCTISKYTEYVLPWWHSHCNAGGDVLTIRGSLNHRNIEYHTVRMPC